MIMLGLTAQRPKTFIMKYHHFLEKPCGLDPWGPQNPIKEEVSDIESQSVGSTQYIQSGRRINQSVGQDQSVQYSSLYKVSELKSVRIV